VDGSEPESGATRPLRTAGMRFERYSSAIKCLSPPALFESRPSYRLLGAALSARRLEFGIATLVSSGGCTTSLEQEFVEDFGWFAPAECLTWTVVKFVSDGVEFCLGVAR